MKRIPVERRLRYGHLPYATVYKCRAGGRHQVGWCFRMCEPVDGRGLCGRVAPHSFKGYAREVLEKYEAEQRRKAS
jgi:hypothetical protein